MLIKLLLWANRKRSSDFAGPWSACALIHMPVLRPPYVHVSNLNSALPYTTRATASLAFEDAADAAILRRPAIKSSSPKKFLCNSLPLFSVEVSSDTRISSFSDENAGTVLSAAFRSYEKRPNADALGASAERRL